MAYKESLLQWIWQDLQFSCHDLRTTCGKKIDIRDNGTLNHGAGPDFLCAHLSIDGLEWHGSVEIHNSAKEWQQHGHQFDKNYNSVVLHVVGTVSESRVAETKEGSKPFTLCLKPYLQKGLYELLQNSKKGAIPCAGNVEFIHQKAFEQQVEMAHKEYFDFKVNEIIQFYPAGVPVIQAWKQALIHQVYRTLGISANKDSMNDLALRVSAEDCTSFNLVEWQQEVCGIAFNVQNLSEQIDWVATGIRPSGKPEKRVKQAAAIQHVIAHQHPKLFLSGPKTAWNEIMEKISHESKPGQMMIRLVYYTAFVPGLYLLGKVLHDTSLMNACYECWSEQGPFLPKKIQAPFKKAGFNINRTVKKLGLAHHYKRYCSQKNCTSCKVFKNAIRA
jgi:hypothetical protein